MSDHPDFTQEVAPNESQRDPKPLASRAATYPKNSRKTK
jgi:hypothetical protein